MKLEEALPYLRKGKKIYRPDDPKERCLEGTLEKPLRSFYLTLFDVLEDDWQVEEECICCRFGSAPDQVLPIEVKAICKTCRQVFVNRTQVAQSPQLEGHLYNSKNEEILCKCGKTASEVIIGASSYLARCNECAGY